MGYSVKNKVGLSENQPKNHKNDIFSKLTQQIWPKIEIRTHTYVWILYPPERFPGVSFVVDEYCRVFFADDL